MKYDPEKHHRRSIRLKGYDYSQKGVYFITICTKNRECLFGEIQQGQMNLNDLGKIVYDTWHNLPNYYIHIELDTFVIMPNHIHGIIILSDIPVGAGFKPAPTNTIAITDPTKRQPLSEIIRALKTFSARRINAHQNTAGSPVWQRNYYEHIIRDENSLNRIRQYIVDNPKNWNSDREHPTNNIVGAGFKPQGAGFKPQGAGFKPQGAGFKPQGAGFKPAPTERDTKQRHPINQRDCY